MAKAGLRLVSPDSENRTVVQATPVRRPNSELRTREHLTPAEVDSLTRSLQAYFGHKNIQHTVRYTELAPNWFKDFWR